MPILLYRLPVSAFWRVKGSEQTLIYCALLLCSIAALLQVSNIALPKKQAKEIVQRYNFLGKIYLSCHVIHHPPPPKTNYHPTFPTF
jgi:hypothetical protein